VLRLSTLFLRTLRDDPADAEVPSHKLLVRAGYVRRVAPGIYSWLPLGVIVQENVARVVRDVEVGALNRITTIHPRTYNEAKNIGESFREGTPVIMNLSDMDDSDAKRLVDFAAGLVFGLHGQIERVTSKVFLLSPAHVEVSAEEGPAAPTAARGLFNQS